MKLRLLSFASILLCCGSAAVQVSAQDAASLYGKWCAVCHEATTESRAPGREVLSQMTPEQILAALETGPMVAQAQGAMISRAERRALAEYLSGKSLGSAPANPIPRSAFCADSANKFQNTLSAPLWNGWGVTITNTRFQPAAEAGLTADDVPQLKLKWAFGFPGATSASSQPVVVGDRVYVGSWEGDFFSLDAKTGCIHWAIQAESGVRSAVTIGKAKNGRLALYFGDLAANIYALDAATGKQLWKVRVDDYPAARVTGSPALYDGRLYVPVSSREESRVGPENFACCGFRGSVVALDAATGKRLWKTYTIDQKAMPTQKNRIGTQLMGPSGVAVWVTPTIDVKRSLLYIGTGNDYSSPATSMSDSIIALDMKSGKIRWFRQFTPNDIWNGDCRQKDRDPAFCPDADAPDFDFSAAATLVDLPGGRQILVVQNKNALVCALDPDQQGKVVWQQRIGVGSAGAVWGPAIDPDNHLYAALADGRLGGGMVALDLLHNGEKLWSTPAPPCGDKKPCSQVQDAALTAIPGVVFSGSIDGHLRAYSTKDGAILWDYDTAHEFTTVNGVTSKGGSISNGGPAIVGGMLFINSGYSHHSGIMPGNVLLAFSVN
jgi:polyvinyl alcohol dehydrogenase (cytochrome)